MTANQSATSIAQSHDHQQINNLNSTAPSSPTKQRPQDQTRIRAKQSSTSIETTCDRKAITNLNSKGAELASNQ
jgi:hypothetical protein